MMEARRGRTAQPRVWAGSVALVATLAVAGAAHGQVVERWEQEAVRAMERMDKAAESHAPRRQALAERQRQLAADNAYFAESMKRSRAAQQEACAERDSQRCRVASEQARMAHLELAEHVASRIEAQSQELEATQSWARDMMTILGEVARSAPGHPTEAQAAKTQVLEQKVQRFLDHAGTTLRRTVPILEQRQGVERARAQAKVTGARDVVTGIHRMERQLALPSGNDSALAERVVVMRERVKTLVALCNSARSALDEQIGSLQTLNSVATASLAEAMLAPHHADLVAFAREYLPAVEQQIGTNSEDLQLLIDGLSAGSDTPPTEGFYAEDDGASLWGP